MIHQHSCLVADPERGAKRGAGLAFLAQPLLDLQKVTARIEELSQAYGINVDPRAYIWQLSVGEQQRVEIMKALYRGANVIILDEPTGGADPPGKSTTCS